jgi:hypothetical protein
VRDARAQAAGMAGRGNHPALTVGRGARPSPAALAP